jgi:hypothetical protein
MLKNSSSFPWQPGPPCPVLGKRVIFSSMVFRISEDLFEVRYFNLNLRVDMDEIR